MRLKEYPIGEYVGKCQTWNPMSSGVGRFDYIDLSSVDKGTKSIASIERYECSDAPSRARQLVEADDVLVATVRPNLNGVALVSSAHHGMTASTGYCVLRPDKDKLDSQFLFHWVKTGVFVQRMVDAATGANYPAVSDAKVKASKIPLPPLTEQKRIAGILDAADALRAKRREALAQLDTLLQSTFLDMFGDPVTNPLKWDTSALGDAGEVITGNTPSRKRSEFYGKDIEWIKSDNINHPSFVLTEAEERLSIAGKAVARTTPKGSILVTCIAGSPLCIGNAAIADREVAFNQQINAFVPSERIALWFAFGVFWVGKRLVQIASTNSMKGMVSKSAFSGISIPIPPMSLQNRFATIAESVERQKASQRAHMAELDTLFASLQSRAFQGDL